ncbi:MAG: hypothetical protein U5L03_10175 [Burkholderiaceae bacterium]|nr:hypothetical protein [Burkholderiaceae bacterium]
MGLPLNPPGVLGQTLGRSWGAAAPASAARAAESSIASTATVPVDRTSGTQFGVQLGAGLSRLWSEAGIGLRAFVHAVQEARMRQALRHIAEIRSRLAPEGAEHELRNRAHFARYY